MTKTIFRIIIWSMITLFISSCSTRHKSPVIEEAPTPKRVQRPLKWSGNHYYYYLLTQLELKNGNIEDAIHALKKAIASDPDSVYLKNDLVMIYLYQKDIDNALHLIEEILAKDPNNIDALINMGKIRYRQENFPEAKVVFEKVIELDPENENLYLLLGNIYMEEEEYDKALSIYERMLNVFPDSFAGHFFLGKIFEKKDNWREAEVQYKKTLELKPELVEPRFALVDLYKSVISDDRTLRKNEKKAFEQKIIETYKGILEQYPDDIRATIEIGYHYYLLGDTVKAENLFENLGLRSLSDTSVIQKIVQLFVDKKKYDEAITIMQGMLKGAPDSSNLHFILGLTYFDGKKNENKAIYHLKQVTPNSKFYENAVVHVAFLLQQQDKKEEAIGYLNNALNQVPNKVDLMFYLGAIYEETEQYDKAEEILLKGIEIEPENTKLHYKLGIIYDKWGRKDDSVLKMKTVIELDPKDAMALNYLGYTMAELGRDLDEAERLIKEALKYKPDDGYITDSLGWVYYKKKRFKEAVKVLKKAVNLVPDDPIILEHLGDAYIQVDEKEKALKYYELSIQRKKEDKEALEKKIKKLKMTAE